jgi:drug/metabolite transporter (DMT)-like permease
MNEPPAAARHKPAAEGRPRLGAEAAAALLMMTAAACFVGMTSTVKLLSAELATPQIVWGRYAAHLVIVLILLRGRLAGVVATARPRVQFARSLLMFAATSLSFLALRWLPLAEVAAIMFLTPVIVTALAAIALGEAVGMRRWAAVATGFAGALVIIRPGLEAVHPAAIAAVLCSACYASYQVTTRVVGDSAPPLVSLFYSCAVGVLVSSLVLPVVWRTPDAAGWTLMALSGSFGALGHLAMIAALARAPASFVTPFTYTQLLWATVVGVVLFGELPDLYTFVGAALIAGSGLYVMHRERVRQRAAAAASVAD